MNSGSTCGKTALEQSMRMIEAVLKDVKATYTRVGGGDITDIKLVATRTYTVSISQEERVDLITYEFDIKSNGQLVLPSAAKIPGHRSNNSEQRYRSRDDSVIGG